MATRSSSQTIMIATIGVAIVLVAVIWPLSMIGKGEGDNGKGDEAELRIQPVARVEMRQAPAAVPGKPRDGATVFGTVCKACHETGVAGAPKIGDKAAWAPRIAQGAAALYASAMKGKNAMPPRGGAPDLSDDEVKAAVDYLAGKAK
jgi:cytochrome c5